MLADWPDLAPHRLPEGMPPTLSDAELLTMAVMSALLGFTSERRWLRYVAENLAGMFPRRIGQSGYNKRMRKAFSLFIRVIRMLAMDTSLWCDDVWGLRLHLVCTLTGLPVLFALGGAKADEREILLDMLQAGRDVVNDHPGQ